MGLIILGNVWSKEWQVCRDEDAGISAVPVLAYLSTELEGQMCVFDFQGHYLMVMENIDIYLYCGISYCIKKML